MNLSSEYLRKEFVLFNSSVQCFSTFFGVRNRIKEQFDGTFRSILVTNECQFGIGGTPKTFPRHRGWKPLLFLVSMTAEMSENIPRIILLKVSFVCSSVHDNS